MKIRGEFFLLPCWEGAVPIVNVVEFEDDCSRGIVHILNFLVPIWLDGFIDCYSFTTFEGRVEVSTS